METRETLMADPNQPLPNVALVTGASRGIGRAIALELAKAGYDIAFCYRQARAAAETLEQEIRSLGRRAAGVQCDVCDFGAVQAWVRQVEHDFGELAVVVNNAGAIRDKSLVSMDQADWTTVLDVNLSSAFHVCRAAIFGMMKRHGGCIINIASIAGVWGNAGQTNYSAAKAGVIGFSNALAKEVGKFGVRVNVVAPGPFRTEMTDALPPAKVRGYIDRTPLGRLGEPEEVGHLVVFLASPHAAFITGQTICIDGGITL
jgi:3-oxoacyl-[acyl-carrier protein] reductase